jgi:hypothetical protein
MAFYHATKPLNVIIARATSLFGIKFKISPIIFKTKVNFAEYSEYIYPLSYLMEQSCYRPGKKSQHI